MEIKAFQQQLIEQYPFFNNLPDSVFGEIENNAVLLNMKKGQIVFHEGDQCQNFALLLSGQIRVYKIGENGREITLYRFGKGSGCILTASGILNNSTFPAIAQVEETGQALAMPANLIKEWVNRYQEWRDYICGLLAGRLSDVITTVEEIAFKRMDIRIARFILAAYTKGEKSLNATHQSIADELGTAREVVSRILKDYEIEGLIELHRGKIVIIDSKKLKKIVEM